MLSDQVSNPGPLTYESGALPIALRGPANYPEYPLLSVALYMRNFISAVNWYHSCRCTTWFAEGILKFPKRLLK